MATYIELTALATGADTLRQQIKMAIAKAAQTITIEDSGTVNHTERLAWARAALGSPDAEVDRVVWYVLAANSTATVAQIQTATDATVQSAVDAAVNLFAS